MKITAGVDVDIWCTKCKANTVGTIVAMVGAEIVQVTCKICGSGPKKYRPAKGKKAVGVVPGGGAGASAPRAAAAPATAKAPKAPKAPRKAPARKKDPSALAAAADLALWQARRDDLAGPPDPYDLRRTYAVGDALKHPKWGQGFVEEVKGDDRMQVLFEEGRKLLVMAYKR